eukprot:jgi/Tetstr1/422717/TSEL_013514.t1
MPGGGFYCSTSGTTFASKEALAEHYRSDFHRYNLKRKVAGLPPVTREWFDARKAQLASSDAAKSAAAERVWICPLTKKKFSSEKTYEAHTRSRKYRDLLKQRGISGEPPAPVVALRGGSEAPASTAGAAPAAEAAAAARPDGAGYSVKPVGPAAAPKAAPGKAAAEGNMDAEGDDSSGWETASDEGGEGGEAWDPRRSLFDNHMSASLEDNLAYMWKNYGFYLPDSDSLADPAGLVAYLGLKLTEGRVPLYTHGDDASARQFPSLHAVQRHMVDTNQCRLAWEGNAEEYEEWYDYGEEEGQGQGEGMEVDGGAGPLAVAGGPPREAGLGAGGYELVVGGDGGGGGGGGRKVLGSREFAQFYRQRHRPADGRASVAAAAVAAQYRALGAPTAPTVDAGQARAQRTAQHASGKHAQLTFMRENINRNLPKNVPY